MPPTGVFEKCLIALLASLWAELEALLGASGPGDVPPSPVCRRAELQAQAVLLELVLLADRCESAQWQALLGAKHLERLRAIVARLRVTLDFSPMDPRAPWAHAAIIEAQNFLYEEVRRTTERHPAKRSADAEDWLTVQQIA